MIYRNLVVTLVAMGLIVVGYYAGHYVNNQQVLMRSVGTCEIS